VDVSAAEQVTDVVTMHGEGPFWDAAAGRLLVVDMLAGAVVALTPSGETSRYELGGVAAALRARQGGGYVLANEHGFQLYTADFTPDGPPIVAFDDPAIRMNDGGCDPQGRFYCGTMAYDSTPGAGTLYRLDPDLTVHPVLTGVTISNGIQWAGDTVYYNDTPSNRIARYTFDPAAGTLADPVPLVSVDQPDGMAMDAEGGIWVALWGGGAIHRYAPDGTLTEQVTVPARQTTACTFAGTTLYITTSRDGLGDNAEPGAGAIFAADVGVTGAPQPAFAA
jgi:sugar lactone lactonase YvrE